MGDFARSECPAVQAQLDRLSLLAPGGDRLGLDRITQLLDRLGNPHRYLPPVFHVAGTNGKGSTCAFLRAGLEAAGHNVHVFTSPHLVRFNERIRLAGRLIEDDHLAELLEEVLDASDQIEPSFFEVTTAAAFLAFARQKADACVVEVGLGGRLDATNVIERPAVCGIAGLGTDHQQFLGDDAISIAREKAGIAKPRTALVTLDYAEEVAGAIAAVAEDSGAYVSAAFSRWSYGIVNGWLQFRDSGGIMMMPTPDLPGAHQIDNCALALAMLRHQGEVEVPFEALRRVPTRAFWPARFQLLRDGPLSAGLATWIDGAHNPQAAAALAELAADRGPMHLVLGILANKDAEAIVGALKPHALSLTFLPVPDHAHHDPHQLARQFEGKAAQGLAEALADLPAPRLIAGSLYLAGEALRLNDEAPD